MTALSRSRQGRSEVDKIIPPLSNAKTASGKDTSALDCFILLQHRVNYVTLSTTERTVKGCLTFNRPLAKLARR
ncbi:MAG: hypothetical protein RBJ76_06205 [Stenomitos frigidus ULC029]